MQSLCKKIRDTKLFNDAQKVELMAALEDASTTDKKRLEAGIDIFDREHKKAVEKHSAQLRSLLGHLERTMSEEDRKANKDAIDEMKLGLTFLTS